MAQNKIQLELAVQDNGSVVVREFSGSADKALTGVAGASERATGRMQAGWEKLKSAWVGVIASIYAVKEAWDMMQTAAKARQERQAFENMAASYGKSGAQIIEELQRVSAGTIDTMTLVRNAGTAMMMGIAPEKISKLMEIARATARQTGQTVTEAFSNISLAVGRQSKLVLDNLGILVSAGKANEEYAKELKIVGRELTDAEKKTAFLNATIKAGDELIGRLGEQTDTAADRMQRFTETITNMKLFVGDSLIRVFQGLEGVFKTLASGALTLYGGLLKIQEAGDWVTDKLHLTSGAAAKTRIDAEAAFGAAEELAGQAAQAFADSVNFQKVAATGQGVYKKAVEDTTTSIKDQAAALKKIDDQRKAALDAVKSEADLKRQAAAEMYQKSGMDAQAYYANEAAALVEKTAKWEKAGVDITKINAYLYDQFGKMATEAWEKGEDAAGDYLDTMQAKSDVLIVEFEQAQNEVIARLDNIGIKAKDLSGTDIALSISLHDGVSTIADRIMSKLSALKAAAALAAVAAGAGEGAAVPAGGTAAGASGSGSATIYEGGSAVNVYVTEKVSRSDVSNIVTEQQRLNERG